MNCPTLLIVTCLIAPHLASGAGHAVSGAATSVAGDFLGSLAGGIRDAVGWIFANTTTWWLRLPSPGLAGDPAVTSMRAWLLPVTAAVAVAAMTAAGLRMVLTRRANPLLDVGGGLAAIAAAATLGVAVPDLLLKAGDAWSGWVLTASTGGAFGSRMTGLLAMTSDPPVIVIVFGMIAVLLAAVQAALLVFRQAALIILAAVLPLAAAGAAAPLTRAWIRKIISWMLALIAYKPAAAAVYAAAFTMIGKGSDLRTVLTGMAMLVLSLVALPVLMRFFTWTTGAVSSSGGGLGQFLGMAAAGAAAMGALRGSSGGAGGSSASEHADYLSTSQQPPASAQADGTATGPAPGGTPGAQPDRPASNSGGTAAGSGAASPGGPGTSATGADSAAGAAGAAGAGGSGSAGAAGAGAGGRAAAGAGTGGVAVAAMMAVQGLASGARNTAASAVEEGDRR